MSHNVTEGVIKGYIKKKIMLFVMCKTSRGLASMKPLP